MARSEGTPQDVGSEATPDTGAAASRDAERPTAAFITLGCKINQYETQAIRQEVLALGYVEVAPTEPADVYVVNTCAVTSMSGVKSRKQIQRAARTNPASRIIVVGCSTPEEKESFRRVPQVAFLAGNEEKAMVAPFLQGTWPAPGRPDEPSDRVPGSVPGGARRAVKRGARPGARDVFSLGVSGFEGRTRATLKVQDGCNSFCSFCIIPFLRGTSRSREVEAIVAEVRRLVEAGFVEIVLSGIHLQDFGVDLEPATSLAGLLERIVDAVGARARFEEGAAAPGVRIRLSSLGPRAFTPALLDVLAHPIFCRHWHVPLQAGSDRVLTAMRRGYSVDRFRDAVGELERRFDSPSITTDVIVGYPGETEADFEETCRVAREIGFAKIHVFPYSVREGTLAAKTARADAVAPPEIRRRARVLGAIDRELSLAYRERCLGRSFDVLVEGPAKASIGGGASGSGVSGGAAVVLEGMADRYLRVRFPAPSPGAAERFPGTVRRVRARAIEGAGVRGVWAEALAEGLAAEPGAVVRNLGGAPFADGSSPTGAGSRA